MDERERIINDLYRCGIQAIHHSRPMWLMDIFEMLRELKAYPERQRLRNYGKRGKPYLL